MMVTHNGVKVSLGLITIARVLYNNNYGLNNFDDRERGSCFYIILYYNYNKFCSLFTRMRNPNGATILRGGAEHSHVMNNYRAISQYIA